MQGREGKIVIEHSRDIIENYIDASASGFVKVYSKFFTKYISKLVDVYLKYLNKEATKDDIEEIYKQYEKEINHEIKEEKNKDKVNNRPILFKTSRPIEEVVSEFWKDKHGKRNINVYNTSYGHDNEKASFMFFVLRKEFYEYIEKYVNTFCEKLDEKERQDIRYRLLRTILNINMFKEALQNIEQIRKQIKDIKGLNIDEATEFLKEFEKIDEYIKDTLEKGLTENDKRVLRVIDIRLNLINFNFNLWSDEEGDIIDEIIILRRPVLGRISVGDKKLGYLDAVYRIIRNEGRIKKSIQDIIKTYKDDEEKRKEKIREEKQKLVEIFYSELPKNLKANIKRMIELVYRERNYKKNRNAFLRTLEHITGTYLELVLAGKINSKIFETHNYYKNQIVASVRDVSIETKSVNVYILYSDEKAGRELAEILTGNYKNKKGQNPIRNKNKILVGTNTSPNVSEEKKDIFIANASFIKNIEELSNFEIPYALNIRELFLHYDLLKNIEDDERIRETWDEKTSIKMLFFIISANALFIALENHARKNEAYPLLFACIDANASYNERQTYMFWDVVKIVARTNMFPLQTYQSISFKEGRGMRHELKSQLGVGLQNLLFSSTRNIRKVKMSWDIKELNLSQKWDKNSLTVYLIVENKTSKLFDYTKNIKAKFYEIFELKLKREERKIDLEIQIYEDKETGRRTFFSFPWDESTVGEIERITSKLRKESEYVFFLSQDKDLLEKNLENAYKVFVRSIIIPLFVEQLLSRKNETNALILHRKELLKFTELIRDSLTRAVFGINSVIPSSFLPKPKSLNKTKQKQLFDLNLEKEEEKEERYERFEKIIGSELNLFWIDERIYDNPADTDLFVISILSWLIFETDTASHPYVKPRWIKRKNGQLILPVYVNSKNTIDFDTTALVFELSELVSVYKGLTKK